MKAYQHLVDWALAKGYQISVYEDINDLDLAPSSDKSAIIEATEACDEIQVMLWKDGKGQGVAYIVHDVEPEETVADYTVTPAFAEWEAAWRAEREFLEPFERMLSREEKIPPVGLANQPLKNRTERPWEYDWETKVKDVVQSWIIGPVIDDEQRSIDVVASIENTRDDSEAIACLIATSPQMLALLKRSYITLNQELQERIHSGNDEEYEDLAKLVADIKDTIDRASFQVSTGADQLHPTEFTVVGTNSAGNDTTEYVEATDLNDAICQMFKMHDHVDCVIAVFKGRHNDLMTSPVFRE